MVFLLQALALAHVLVQSTSANVVHQCRCRHPVATEHAEFQARAMAGCHFVGVMCMLLWLQSVVQAVTSTSAGTACESSTGGLQTTSELIERCGRLWRSLHRDDSSLARGLDLPAPPKTARYQLRGQVIATSESGGRAQILASHASGNSCWHLNHGGQFSPSKLKQVGIRFITG